MAISDQSHYELDGGVISVARHFSKSSAPFDLIRASVIQAAKDSSILTLQSSDAIIDTSIESRSMMKEVRP